MGRQARSRARSPESFPSMPSSSRIEALVLDRRWNDAALRRLGARKGAIEVRLVDVLPRYRARGASAASESLAEASSRRPRVGGLESEAQTRGGRGPLPRSGREAPGTPRAPSL